MAKTYHETMMGMLEFAQKQVSDSLLFRSFAEDRVERCNPYDAQYYQKEIDRCTGRIAYFQNEVAVLTWVIEEAFGEGSITPKLQRITAELRHLYKNMMDPSTNGNPAGMARGILSHQISCLEDLTK